MTAFRTNFANSASTVVSGNITAATTSIQVDSTATFPAVPFYAVIDPASDTNREVILVDGVTATSFELSNVANRGFDGTTARDHVNGTPVKLVPVAATFNDMHDRLDAATGALFHVRDEKPAGTHGGAASTAGTWTTRTLNAVVTNEIAGASLANDTITLPAGTYDVDARTMGMRINGFRGRLYDVTGTRTLVPGSATHSNTSYGGTLLSLITGRFTLAVQSDLRIELVYQTTNANTWALGHAGYGEEIEVYSDVMIRRAG